MILLEVTDEDNSDREDEIEIEMEMKWNGNPDSDTDRKPSNSKQQPILSEYFHEEIDLILVSK